MSQTMALFLCVLLPISMSHASTPTDALWAEKFIPETSALIAIPTHDDPTHPAHRVKNLTRVKIQLQQWATAFNQQLQHDQLQAFEWQKRIDGKDYWLFGFRLGRGAHKIAMLTHVDTVPPGQSDWQPYQARIEKREYLGEKQVDFLVGRGAMDNKGPAISAFIVLRRLAQQYDGADVLNQVTLELIFDTSEETDMATPHYLKDAGTDAPDFGIVFDAMWCVRAEKGIERPVFRVSKTPHNTTKLWIEHLQSTPGPVNQIPSSAQAVIKSADPVALSAFYQTVLKQYQTFSVEPAGYRRARMDAPIWRDNAVLLTTHVLGAQHGSAPQENLAAGANPLVSLSYFLGGLVEQQTLAANAQGVMAVFMRWLWGTHVFGEGHEALQAFDAVFEPGNGTTYALTQVQADSSAVRLHVDIRYAMPHHSTPWDGQTEGVLPGKSRFQAIFKPLLARFNQRYPLFPVRVATHTAYGPDIRLPSNAYFTRVNQAYQAVMGEPCQFIGIGGGTDAKGHPELLAVGALFSPDLGPPVNFHGDNEGAPLPHLRKSTQILYQILANELEHKVK